MRFVRSNAIALVALVFAMTGTGIAATHYVITSTSQIKPSVLKQLREGDQSAGAAKVKVTRYANRITTPEKTTPEIEPGATILEVPTIAKLAVSTCAGDARVNVTSLNGETELLTSSPSLRIETYEARKLWDYQGPGWMPFRIVYESEKDHVADLRIQSGTGASTVIAAITVDGGATHKEGVVTCYFGATAEVYKG